MEHDNTVDTCVDKYITTLLDKSKEYDLSSRAKEILNFVVYLLLNTDFQYILRSMRLGLSMPIDGFNNESEIGLWKEKFRESVNKYHTKGKIEPGIKFMISEIEKKMGGALVDSKKKVEGILAVDMCDDTISMTAQFMLEFLKFKDTKNVVYWLEILKRLLVFDSPIKLLTYLQGIGKTAGEQDVFIELRKNRIVITIVTYPDTTFEDLKQLIEVKRSKISSRLREIKHLSRISKIKIEDIKRDYFIYKTYLGVKWDKKDEGKHVKRKDDRVQEKASEMLKEEESLKIEDLTYVAVRQVVKRMKTRIGNTVPQDKERLNRFISSLNSS